MGCLNGFSEAAPQPVPLKFMESAPAKLDILDRAKGIEAIRRSEDLTEREKVKQASMILVNPADSGVNQRPSHRSQSQLLPPENTGQSEAGGSTQLFRNAGIFPRRQAPFTGTSTAVSAKASNFMAPSQRNSTLRMRGIQQNWANKSGELAFPNLPMHRDSKTGASLVPRPISSKTWTQTQQEMFNPHTFNPSEGNSDDDAKGSEEQTVASTPRRVSHF